MGTAALGNDLKCLGTQDVIVVNGGTNDIDSKRNQTHKVLVHMAQFIQENVVYERYYGLDLPG